MPTQNRWKTAWLSRFSHSQAYTKPTRCLHQPTLATGTITGTGTKIRMKKWKNERMKKWVVNPITAKRNTLTAFSPSPWATGVFRESTECAFGPTKVSESPFAKVARAGVRLLGCSFWPVCKTYAYWPFWNSLENFLLCNVQTIANQPEYHKIL